MRVSASAVWFGLGMLVGGRRRPPKVRRRIEPGPDIELLEYLGGLVQEQGRWVGPDDMRAFAETHGGAGACSMSDDGCAKTKSER